MADIRKELVLSYIQKYRPSTIEDLRRKLANDGIGSTDEALLDAIRELHSDGSLKSHYPHETGSFFSLLGDVYSSWWIYLAAAMSIVELLLVSYTPSQFFLVFMRMIFGFVILGFLPGYTTVRCLFPGRELREFEQLFLSVFLSVAISIGIGVALGFAYVFTAVNSVLFSTGYIVITSFLAIYRQNVRMRAGSLASKR